MSATKTSRFSKEFAKIKKMGKLCGCFLILAGISLPLRSVADCGLDATDAEVAKMVERINQRYDDFYKRQRESQESEQRRESAAGEVRKTREESSQLLEHARAEYVKNRKQTVVDPRLEEEAIAQDKAWKERIKKAQVCFLEQKKVLESLERRGRRVPEKKEYDLED